MVTDAVNTAQHSAKVASVVGIVGLIWVGSSFAVAVASAYNVAWRVPRRGCTASGSRGSAGSPGPRCCCRRQLRHRRVRRACRALVAPLVLAVGWP